MGLVGLCGKVREVEYRTKKMVLPKLFHVPGATLLTLLVVKEIDYFHVLLPFPTIKETLLKKVQYLKDMVSDFVFPLLVPPDRTTTQSY